MLLVLGSTYVDKNTLHQNFVYELDNFKVSFARYKLETDICKVYFY